MAIDTVDVEVRSEPLTYSPGGRHSFFADLIRFHVEREYGAEQRLVRHEREMAVETRVNPNTTLGQGGEFTPPLWLITKFGTAVRAGRTFADLLNPILLPPGVASVHVPKVVGGWATAVQAGNGVAVGAQDPTTVDVSSNVVTIAGDADVSQQLFDQTPIGFDVVAFRDLNRDYNAKLESQLLTGSGAAGQLLGLANFSIPAANSVDGSTATTLTLLWPMLGKIAANIGNNRLLAPEVFLMAPRRWFWTAASLDSSNRPIVSPGGAAYHVNADGAGVMAGGMSPFGPIHGLATYLDGAIPAGASADTVYAVRPSDMYLYESAPKTMVIVNSLSGLLQVRLRYYRYVAFVGNQYTGGLGTVTNIPAPAGF